MAHKQGIFAAGVASLVLQATSPLAAQNETIVVPAHLISFEGLDKLAAAAARHRMLTRKLTYKLEVDKTGKPTRCAFDCKFRRKVVELALCRPLLRYMTFDPGRNAAGDPVSSTFKGLIDFDMWMGTDGMMDPEDRN